MTYISGYTRNILTELYTTMIQNFIKQKYGTVFETV